MMMGMQYLMVLMLFFGAGPTSGNDALDMIPTTAYWQAKHVAATPQQLQQDAAPAPAPANVDKFLADLASDDFKTRDAARKALEAMGPPIAPLLKPALKSKDPEIAATAATLEKEFAEHGSERAVRRLMAIRTLGERKDQTALPLLKTMTDSKDLFVADYARRAIAVIDGKPLPKNDHRPNLAGDLQLLPKGTGIVIQATGMPGTVLTLDKIVDAALDPANRNGIRWGMGPPPNGMTKDKMLRLLTKKSLEGLDRVGDLRIDGVTVGVSENIGPNGGWAIIALRGKYDHAAMVAAIKAAAGPDVKATRNGDIDILDIDPDMEMIFPSDDQMIFLPADDKTAVAPMREKILAVIHGGKGEFEQNTELLALMKTVDTAAPAWAAVRLNADMRKEKPFDAFTSITLSTSAAKDKLLFTITGQGDDAAKIKSTADDMTQNVTGAIADIKPIVGQMKSLQVVEDMLESIKIAAAEKSAIMTGEIKTDITNAIGAAAPMMTMGLEDVPEEDGTQPAVGTSPMPEN